jgi:uncharacterized protein DUF3489
MTTYTIDNENNVTAFASVMEAKSQPMTERFSSAKELGRLAEKWPASRLVETWNSLPGVTTVKKFTSRKCAVVRIWAAIQSLAPNIGAQEPGVGPKGGRPGRRARKKEKTTSARDGSKKANVLALLRRGEGATLQDLMAATGWQAHSVRGFLSGALGKKMGLAVESAKRDDGARVYSIAG